MTSDRDEATNENISFLRILMTGLAAHANLMPAFLPSQILVDIHIANALTFPTSPFLLSDLPFPESFRRLKPTSSLGTMKLSTVSLFLVVQSSAAFSVPPAKVVRNPTTLKYTVFAGIEEDEDSESQREAFVPRGNRSKDRFGPSDVGQYQDYNELDGENSLNVDSYSNMAGSSIMPGFQLTALMGDD